MRVMHWLVIPQNKKKLKNYSANELAILHFVHLLLVLNFITETVQF
jgi:hypothetical protein